MTRLDCDLAVLGSGFGGTLLAVVARALGLSVAVLERGTHPRFAIGESSTPLADFKLARIADRFGLDWLRPLAKYGPWKATYPHLSCGLKRGFSFFRHRAGEVFTPTEGNTNALVVAASPTDATADTHWYRPDFDAHLVERATAAGAHYLDRCEVHSLRHTEPGWEIEGARPGGAVRVRAGLLIDATGTGQALAEALKLEAVDPAQLRTRSRALYSHFRGVAHWHDVLGPAATADHPFPCDAAALHQIIDGGWMWVLRFENDITSAGFSLDPERHPVRPDESPDAEWRRLLNTYPSLARQFADAVPTRPLVRTGRLQRRLTRAAGPDWALLPHAAGFLDAWLSPGIAQTLYAVNRLANVLADEPAARPHRLAGYGDAVLRELAWVDEITGTCFACLDRFPVLATAVMVYFTAAIFCEERERRGEAGPDEGFLLADHAEYRAAAARLLAEARTTADAEAFLEAARRELEPYNSCGMCDPRRRNMYPYTASHAAR
ncbi:MAG: tryptophan 7-halogenase [Gemmataceae bacterium]